MTSMSTCVCGWSEDLMRTMDPKKMQTWFRVIETSRDITCNVAISRTPPPEKRVRSFITVNELEKLTKIDLFLEDFNLRAKQIGQMWETQPTIHIIQVLLSQNFFFFNLHLLNLLSSDEDASDWIRERFEKLTGAPLHPEITLPNLTS